MNWLRRLMQGRYGSDQLSFALLAVSLIFNALATFTRITVFSFVSLAAIILCFYRIFSGNIEKRRNENLKFLAIWNKVKCCFLRKKDKISQCRQYRFFKCPSCSNTLRVPKGKGKIYITCPRCGERFIKKT